MPSSYVKARDSNSVLVLAKQALCRLSHLPSPFYLRMLTDQSKRRIQRPSSPKLQVGHPKQKLGEFLLEGCLFLCPAQSPGAVLAAQKGTTLDLWILCRQMRSYSILFPVSSSPLPGPSQFLPLPLEIIVILPAVHSEVNSSFSVSLILSSGGS